MNPGWQAVLEHAPQIMAALGAGIQAIAVAEHVSQPQKVPTMSEAPNAPGTDAGSSTLQNLATDTAALAQLAPAIATANGASDATVNKVVNTAAVVNSVIASVAAHPDVPAHRVASVATAILQGLMDAEPAIFALTRSSAGTQAAVNTSATLAEVLLGALAHV